VGTVFRLFSAIRLRENTTKTDLRAFKYSLRERSQLTIVSHAICRLRVAIYGSLWGVTMVMSSAYAMNITRKSNFCLRKSSTSIFHKKGDSTPPCGHPRQTGLEKVESWTEIEATLLERKL
jgi:hypothetical protein